MRSFINESFKTLPGQLRTSLFLGGVFLLILFFNMHLSQEKLTKEFTEAYHLNYGTANITSIQKAVDEFNVTLKAAGNVFKPKSIAAKYQQQMQTVEHSLQEMQGSFSQYESTRPLFDDAHKALIEIDVIAQKILADDWSVSEFNSYLRTLARHQIQFKKSLDQVAAEHQRLIDHKYQAIYAQKNQPFYSGLKIMLILATLWSIISLVVFRKVKVEITKV